MVCTNQSTPERGTNSMEFRNFCRVLTASSPTGPPRPLTEGVSPPPHPLPGPPTTSSATLLPSQPGADIGTLKFSLVARSTPQSTRNNRPQWGSAHYNNSLAGLIVEIEVNNGRRTATPVYAGRSGRTLGGAPVACFCLHGSGTPTAGHRLRLLLPSHFEGRPASKGAYLLHCSSKKFREAPRLQ